VNFSEVIQETFCH